MRRTLQIAALALLLLLAAALAVVVQRWLAARDEANAPPPPQQAIEKAPRASPITKEPVDLGATLALDRLAGCARSPALASVLDQMVRMDPQTFESRRGGAITVAGYDRAITPTFERTREVDGNADIRLVVADLDLPGRWHGLAVIGLRHSFYEESDVGGFQVRFAEPPARVRAVLNRRGFRLPAIGEVRELQEEGATVMLGVEADGDGAGLTCATG